VLVGADAESASRDALEDALVGPLPTEIVLTIEAEFYRRLAELPALREGVRPGLEALEAMGAELVCITEGAKSRTISRLLSSDLDRFFCRVVEGRKTDRLFARLRGLRSETMLMVGDQLSKDILPAKNAGFRTVYFPGGFQPKWELTLDSEAEWTVRSFAELPIIVKTIESSK
jgi:putative hydrolase of the HAD superfamily